MGDSELSWPSSQKNLKRGGCERRSCALAAARAGGCGQLRMGCVDLSLERDKPCRVASSNDASLRQLRVQRSRTRRKAESLVIKEEERREEEGQGKRQAGGKRGRIGGVSKKFGARSVASESGSGLSTTASCSCSTLQRKHALLDHRQLGSTQAGHCNLCAQGSTFLASAGRPNAVAVRPSACTCSAFPAPIDPQGGQPQRTLCHLGLRWSTS